MKESTVENVTGCVVVSLVVLAQLAIYGALIAGAVYLVKLVWFA